ncbi:MAG: TonB-dependent receptor, partial [Saprospiraceae bacterium]|nr:TonB-dependent receptor [Saprospiraceae bacterium]
MKSFLIICLVVVAFSLSAQNIKDSTHIETIVITDSKIPKTSKQSTKNIITISSREIRESSYSRLGDILDQVPGITVNGSLSNPGKDQIIYTQGTESDFTLFLLDGQPIHDPTSIGGSFDMRLLNLAQVDRIEILKGNQSVLYGSDAVAGVINIISKNHEDQFNASASLAYGSFNTIEMDASINGKSNRLSYFLQGQYSDSKGISEAEDESGNSDFDNDGYEKINLDAGLGYQLTDYWKIRLTGTQTEWESMYDDGAFTDGTSAYDASAQRFSFSSLYQKDVNSLSILLARTSSDRIFKTEFGDFIYEGQAWNADLFGSTQISDQLNLTMGYQYQNNESVTDIADMIVHSPYLNLICNLSSYIKFEAGYRFTDNSDFGVSHDYSFSASYFPNPDLRVYGNWSTGFKAPLLAQLYGPFG